MSDSRYPYTYACDFIRALSGYSGGGTKLSRADASRIRMGMAKILNMEDRKLAELLADAQKSKSKEIIEKEVKECLSMVNLGRLLCRK